MLLTSVLLFHLNINPREWQELALVGDLASYKDRSGYMDGQ